MTAPLTRRAAARHLVFEVGRQVVRGHAYDVRRRLFVKLSEERGDGWLKLFKTSQHAIVLSHAEFDRIVFTFNP
jgi:hypothetical protein